MASSNGIRLPLDAYTVGWVCVLEPEFAAARVLLDEKHDTPSTTNDDNIYLVGRMGEHNVAIIRSTNTGRSAATAAATHLVRTFEKIRFVLMVGVGGGATNAPSRPGSLSPTEDIFLGDVVVGSPHGDHGGVLQYDMGTQHPDGYQRRSHLNKPGPLLIQASQYLQGQHGFMDGNMDKYIHHAIFQLEQLSRGEFQCPGSKYDLLFRPEYYHNGTDTERCWQCCDTTQLVKRTRPDVPRVHYGLIGSADTVIQDGQLRDRMRQSDKVLCFEMEAAGLMDSFPCLVIRGISDYADTHKNKVWQPYAALTAAAYAKDLLSVIQAQRVEDAELALTLLKEDIHKVREGVEEIHSIIEDRERNEIINWLTPLDSHTEQQRLLDNCVPWGKQLIESKVFQHWVGGAPWQLRCYGAAGVGKTHLCAVIVDHLQTMLRMNPRQPVIYIYLSDETKKRDSQTRDNVLGSLVKQLILFNSSVPIPSGLRKASKNQLPREAALKHAFEELLGEYERTYLVVDGFYQCSSDVLHILKDYPLDLIRKGVSLSLLTTSPSYRQAACVINCDGCKRPDLKVFFNCHCNDSDFDLCLKCKVEGVRCLNSHHTGKETYDTVRVEICPTEEDIIHFCDSRLTHGSSPEHRLWDKRIHPEPPYNDSCIARYLRDNPGLKKAIAREIAKKAQGNFLVAHECLQVLLKADKIPQDWDVLLARAESKAFDALESHYDSKIECVKNYNMGQALAFKVFRVLMTTCRPINILTLQHALALERDEWLDEENLEHRVSILRATNGLITIDKADDANSIVRFFHGALKRVLGKSHLDPSVAESEMAKLCLMYLQHEDYAKHSANLAAYPFLYYTLQHWGDHVRSACDEHNSVIEGKALWLLNDPDSVKAIAREAGKVLPSGWIHEGIGAVHFCAWFGLSTIVKKLHRDGHSFTEPDRKHGRTPLQYACRQGHVATVKALLALNVPPSDAVIMDVICGFPYMDRDEKERVDIAEILLSGRTLNSGIDALGTTVLMMAVKHGYYDFVDTLLREKSIDINVTDRNGRTALWFAVDSHPAPLVPLKTDLPDGIIGLLLRKGADPNIQCQKTGKSVLAHARSSRRSAATAILLKCDRLELSKEILPDVTDAQEKLGLTPLQAQLAAEGRSLSSSQRANFSIDLSAGDTLPEPEIRTMKSARSHKRRLPVIDEGEKRRDKQIKVQ
ncbi:hypothetical protein ASPVEDRAFT_147980 [Aspergillus versicolor CBS 583.65]|uniref:Uncharacterized protein n=1 Tax=Aspergillus versicolor CBS 583.65 TaxID=1036611 RepID=A0A1L9PBG2_ASPVE|nr:uncharacterized protein ASPVEDRAFT_147980 [Aspergillus versicolor CBS 583.65]OJI98795.1 hypothetical protein ASPVEDRAFT_147980 [Aspergillus versicolor CBS 583.65]